MKDGEIIKHEEFFRIENVIKKIPQFAGYKKLTIKEAKFTHLVWRSKIFIIEVDGHKLCFKIAKPEVDTEEAPIRAQTQFEISNLLLSKNLQLAPKVHFVGQLDSLSYIIYDYIEGEIVANFNDSNLQSLASQLNLLHSEFKSDKYGYFNREIQANYEYNLQKRDDWFGSEQDIYNQDKYKLLTQSSEETKNIFFELQARIIQLLEQNQSIISSFHTFSLTHGDIKSSNVLVSGRDVKLIDWEDARFDLPCIELGRTFARCNLTLEQKNKFLQFYFEGQTVDENSLKLVNIFYFIRRFGDINDNWLWKHNKKAWQKDLFRQELENLALEINAN